MGVAAGGELAHVGSYQGHATVTDAAPGHAPLLVTYASIVNGGILVNAHGERFGNEDIGYSEFSAAVLAQGERGPGPEGARGVVEIYGEETALACADTRLEQAITDGAVLRHDDLASLAAARRLPLDTLRTTVAEVNRAAADPGAKDAWGRAGHRGMTAPFYSIAVKGALFHTQGGLRVDSSARVLRAGERAAVVPRLFAAGGAAAGVSGDTMEGYLSGNGLLCAAVLGRWAGEAAAQLVAADDPA